MTKITEVRSELARTALSNDDDDDATTAFIVRYLPFAVGLIAAFGLLGYGGWIAWADGGSAADRALTAAGAGSGEVLSVVTGQATDNGLVLEGRVPDEAARSALMAAADDAYDGTGDIVDNLTVDGDVTEVTLRLAGTVSADQGTSLTNALGGVSVAGGTVSIDNQLQVAAPATAAPTTTAAPATTAAPTTTASPTTAAAPTTTAPVPPPPTAAAPSPAAAVALSDQINALITAGPINFSTDLAEIRPESIATLDQIGVLLASQPTARFEVQGHADSRGDEATNVALSQERAAAVVQYLGTRAWQSIGSSPRATDRASPSPLRSPSRAGSSTVGCSSSQSDRLTRVRSPARSWRARCRRARRARPGRGVDGRSSSGP